MAGDGEKKLWRRLLGGWNAIAGRFGAVQTLVILGLFYVALIGPMALVAVAIRSDHLQKRRPDGDASAWCDADSQPPDLERARHTS
jgi:hypothetical protein